MASFLSHLVQRTRATSPTMMPRLAGVYESVRDAAAWRSDGAGHAADAPEPVSHASAAPRADATRATSMDVPVDAPQRGVPLEPLAMQADGRPPMSLQPQVHSPQRRAPHADVKPAPLAAGSREQGPQHAALPPLSGAPGPALPRIVPPALRHDGPLAPARLPRPIDETNATQRNPSTTPGLPPMRPDAGTRTADGDSPSSVVPAVDASPAARGARPQGMLVEPPPPRPAIAHGAAGDASLPIATRALAAPTVHVTIGRIELRAATPAAAAPRAAASRPALSLNDYLSRRNAGRAR